MLSSTKTVRNTQEVENASQIIAKAQQIPYNHLIFNPKKDLRTVINHCKSVYDSIFFIQNLDKTIKDKILNKTITKRVMLKSPSAEKKNLKTLFIDLDETLIHHPTKQLIGTQLKLNVENIEVPFILRPYAIEFLINMSEFFQLVLFSSATKSYAEAFFHYLNSRTNNAFSEFLCRDHCVHLYKNIFLKDLRVIGNRNLRNMILLDNSVYCMGLLISNGVPIASFTGDSNDQELLHLEQYLRSLKDCEDVREINSQELNLVGILEVAANPLH